MEAFLEAFELFKKDLAATSITPDFNSNYFEEKISLDVNEFFELEFTLIYFYREHYRLSAHGYSPEEEDGEFVVTGVIDLEVYHDYEIDLTEDQKKQVTEILINKFM